MPYINNTGTARTWAYAERFTLNYNEQYQRAIRNGRYKLIKRAGGSRQFFDLEVDPFETKNLLQNTLTDVKKSNLSALDSRMNALLA